MRVPAMTMCAILAGGAFLSLGATGARADATGPAFAAQTQAGPPSAQALRAQPATRVEERDYARREAKAPAAVKKYAGGFIAGLLVLVVLVLLIVYLVQRT